MLHTLFFILSFLMDYHAVTDALRSGFTLGSIGACAVCVAVAWLTLRGRTSATHPRTDVK